MCVCYLAFFRINHEFLPDLVISSTFKDTRGGQIAAHVLPRKIQNIFTNIKKN